MTSSFFCRSGSWFLSLVMALLLVVVAAQAATAEPRTESRSLRDSLREPTPLEDDAQLHDVQFLGSNRGWCVGDRGVIWSTDDGGENWVLQASGVECPLRSVCFLSDRVGWVAGGGTVPFTRQSYGVVLATTDGGQTWKNLVAPPPIVSVATDRNSGADVPGKLRSGSRSALPRLRKIRFFSLEDGIAVGEGAGFEPSGVYRTGDGGQTWQALPGQAAPGWRSADFFDPETGILVGGRDSLGAVAEGRVTLPRMGRLGLRNRHALTLDRDRSGWLVGDGGLALQTENDGLVWQAPASPLPAGVRDVFDFRTVCQQGEHVWLAGHPGSTVWHSPDRGQSWQRQHTGQAVPLAKLYFTTPERGWGVGALGLVLRTVDGGRTWRAVRGSDRRVALFSLHSRLDQVSLAVIAEMSAEQGYRSLVSVIAGSSGGSEGLNEVEGGDRLQDAVIRAGGSRGEINWRWPLVLPDLERDFERLVADWNRRTENRLDEVLESMFVRDLRTWRPSVLIMDAPDPGMPLAKLIGDVLQRAVTNAADATSHLELQELAGLEPWKVDKVFVRLPPGKSGTVQLDPFHYLPHVGETTQIIAAQAAGLILETPESPVRREAFRPLGAADDRPRSSARKSSVAHSPSELAGSGNLFAGISLTTDGPARRRMLPLDDSRLEVRMKGIQKLRNFAAVSDQMLVDDRRAGQLIAQLPGLTRGLSDTDAAWQLWHLAERYQEMGQWELAELALTELIEKHPAQPAGLRATQRLMQSWASSEVTWRRLRKAPTEIRRQQNRPDLSIPQAVQFAEARLQEQSERAQRTVFNSDDAEPEDVLNNPVATPRAETEPRGVQKRIVHRDLELKQRSWRNRALKMLAELKRRDPALAADPSIQFPLAAIHRQRTAHLKADEIYQRYAQTVADTPWNQAARGEFWLGDVSNPPTSPVARCGITPERPELDGRLEDACWKQATPLPLVADVRNPDRAIARAWICCDGEFLYFAASLPRAEGFRTDGPFTGTRRHDEDLSEFDRVVLSFDVDRDYVTSFEFAVDQRGCTHDACWHDASWNPRWFVAVQGQATEWTVEAAIPFDELVPYIPGRGIAWALGITRIIPAVGLESWSRPASAVVRPETAGLLRFEPALRMAE